MTVLSRRMLGVAAGALALALGFAAPAQAEPKIEVLHWWTSGSESRAISVLRKDFEAQGGTWTDSPIAGGAGDAAMTALRARAMAGTPPGAAQIKGPEIQDWAAMGVLTNLDDLATEDKWADILPPAVQTVMQSGGHYVAVPVNIHRINWVWANPQVLAKVGATEVPDSWEEFNALADKLKAAGITPLAHGGQPWQDFTVWETVALGLGGPEYFKKAFVDLDDATIRSDTTKQVFDQFRKLRGYVDDNFSGRDWNLASGMVMNGQAAMQIMGDWAKGEFIAAGKVPGTDFLCTPTPGEDGVLMNVDSFAMFKQSGADEQAGQKLFAQLMLGEPFQKTFNLAKGSIPVRLGMDLSEFDSCAQKSAADVAKGSADGSLLPSVAHKMAVPAAVFGAMQDEITEFFNSDMSSEDGVTALADAIAAAK